MNFFLNSVKEIFYKGVNLMIATIQVDDKVVYGVNSYVCDNEDDVKDLPIYVNAGSTAFVIETSSLYMLNSKREWKKI